VVWNASGLLFKFLEFLLFNLIFQSFCNFFFHLFPCLRHYSNISCKFGVRGSDASSSTLSWGQRFSRRNRIRQNRNHPPNGNSRFVVFFSQNFVVRRFLPGWLLSLELFWHYWGITRTPDFLDPTFFLTTRDFSKLGKTAGL